MLILSTDSLKGYGLNRIFGFAKEADYDGLELVLDKKEFDTQNADYVKDLVKEYKMPVVAVRTFKNSTIKKTEIVLKIAQELKAKTVILDSPKIFDFKYAEWMKKEVPSLRKKYGVSIALKNSPHETLFVVIPGRAMSSMADLQNFKQVCLDTAYLYSKKIDLMKAYRMVKKYMVHVHLSNVRHERMHSFPTEGIIPLESLLTKLKKDKYKGDVSVLVRPQDMKVGKDKEVLEKLGEIKSFYENYFGK